MTIEDSAELKFARHPHVVRLEARTESIEGKGEVSIRQLVANALRMRPDRIVVGEVRGEECIDMLQAMNTGHDGLAHHIACGYGSRGDCAPNAAFSLWHRSSG